LLCGSSKFGANQIVGALFCYTAVTGFTEILRKVSDKQKCSHDRPPVGSVSFGFNMAKSGVKPLTFLIAVSVMAWVTGMAIHGF
jgi:hypothetical protein